MSFSKSALFILASLLLIAYISASVITIERTHSYTALGFTLYIGTISIDGQSYGKTWEEAVHALPANDATTPSYPVSKVYSYEGRPQCSNYDCMNTALNANGDEVLIVKYGSSILNSKHIRLGASVNRVPLTNFPLSMNNAASVYNSVMAKLGTDLEDNKVTLVIVDSY